MEDLVISGSVLDELHFSPHELKVEIAVYLYNSERLTLGQAKKLGGLTHLEFQKELSKRGINIKFDIDDLETDLKNLSFITPDGHSE